MFARAVLIQIEAAGLELTEGHAASAAARSEDDGLDSDVVQQRRLAGGGRDDADADKAAGTAQASGEGRPKTMPSLRPQISGSPGAWGWIHGEEVASDCGGEAGALVSVPFCAPVCAPLCVPFCARADVEAERRIAAAARTRARVKSGREIWRLRMKTIRSASHSLTDLIV